MPVLSGAGCYGSFSLIRIPRALCSPGFPRELWFSVGLRSSTVLLSCEHAPEISERASDAGIPGLLVHNMALQ